ncbi:MAG: hypothetical protein NVS4B11_21840 [Ktedonobacteraceae bacterium]
MPVRTRNTIASRMPVVGVMNMMSKTPMLMIKAAPILTIRYRLSQAIACVLTIAPITMLIVNGVITNPAFVGERAIAP